VVPVRSLFWSVPREWPGETVFILGGGTSVLNLDLSKLAGRRVIVINTSYLTYPSADALVFSDPDWWGWHVDRKELKAFAGTIISLAAGKFDKRFKPLMRFRPDNGLATNRGAACINATTMTAAINVAMHYGAKRCVLLGLDGKAGNGRTHHHEKHPYDQREGNWARHATDLNYVAKSAAKFGLECVNVNPDSAHRMFPFGDYEEEVARV